MTRLRTRQQYILQMYQRPDFVLDRGEGVYLFDTVGRRYLDCVAGIAVNALGYGDPDVARAIAEHAGGLIHTSNLYHAPGRRAGTAACRKLVCRPCVSEQQRRRGQRGCAQVRAQVRPRA